MSQTIRFDDGAAYERGMGAWSQLVGATFLDWLAPARGQRWLDVGCGNGAFTELVIGRCAPTSIDGVDPSEGQLDFARRRPGTAAARFHQGEAHALPFADDSIDIAVMALVIFFLPDPAAGLAELVRIVRPGGLVTAYAWDIPARSFPLEPVQAELRALGQTPFLPPSAAIASPEPLRAAFARAGLGELRQRTITVTRDFADFDAFWTATVGMGTLSKAFEQLSATELAALQNRVRARLTAHDGGRVSYAASANAIVGRVPAA